MSRFDELNTLLDAFDPEVPLAKAKTIPSSWYHDPRMAEAERELVFGDSWQAVGRVDQLADPGSFVTEDVACEPVAIVRGDDEMLRAFANVCRHRAARVLEASEGRASRLRCRYHGWTYDLNGRLRGTPEFDGVEDFCREDNSLHRFSADAWGRHVWVHMGANPTPLQQSLSPMPESLAPFDLARQRFVERRIYDVECNWKVYVENYLDGGYHVNTVHPSLAGVLDYSQYRTINAGLTSLQTSPMVASADAATSNVRKGQDAQYWWVFPNFMLNLYEGLMDTNLVLPLGPKRCRVIFDMFFAETEGDETKPLIAESINVTDRVQIEDMAICAEVRRGLESRYYDAGRYAVRRESAVHHFHRLLAGKLRNGAVHRP